MENFDYITPIAKLVILALLGYVSREGSKVALQYWREANPDEYMIILRGGEMIKAGIGLKTFIFPGDTCITYPCRVQRVNFTANQVTEEMQGVEVTGMLVWSIYRLEDGPFKCYKSFGDDLKLRTPILANEKIENLAVSIIRDRIANMAISDVLKNRHKLRSGVREEIQKLVTGWGIWLETIEILDVKIASSSLFKNLQTEFREKTRQQAETISAETNNLLRQEHLERETVLEEMRRQTQNEQQMFEQSQNLQLNQLQGELYEEETHLNVKLKELDNQNTIKEEEMLNFQKSKTIERSGQKEAFNNSLQIEKEKQTRDFNTAYFETQAQRTKHNQEKTRLSEEQARNHKIQELELRSKHYTPNVMKADLIGVVDQIYRNANVKEYNVVNVGKDDGKGNQSAAAVLGSMMTQYNAIANATK